jgi:DNA-binding MarR family transcriptional regulator
MATAKKQKRSLAKTIAIPEARLQRAEAAFPAEYRRDSARGIFAIRALARMVDDRANAWLAPFGINAAQHNYLTTLYFSPRGLTLRDLSLLVHTSNSAVTPIVGVLEQLGLVKRAFNPDDGRSVVAAITRKGRALIEKSFRVHHDNLERGLAQLTAAERKTLADLLEKVGASFESAFRGEDA